MKQGLLTCMLALIGWSASAQVSIQPTFATQADTVTITFDASAGNGALSGATQVYAHTGVITNLSSTSVDWRHVQGTWGTDDQRLKMTALGNNLFEIRYHIASFYNVPSNETVSALAFVFRNQDGSVVGRAADGSDIFVPIYSGGFSAAITSPSQGDFIASTTDSVLLLGQSSLSADLAFEVDGNTVASASGVLSLQHNLKFNTLSAGRHTVVFSADDGNSIVRDTLELVTRSSTPQAPLPGWGRPGYQWRNDSLYLQLRAPGKSFVYVVGSFNQWKLDEPYQMNQSANGDDFWLILDNLNPGDPVSFQYFVGEEGIRIADPYSTMVLDPWNDQWIEDSTYSNLPEYPVGKTSEPVTYTDPNALEYSWDNSYSYERPDKEELIVYELLIRDFRHGHTFNSVIEQLDYFTELGVNAIELMPVMEFEGNESWGYNPSFFFAVDKYYGPTNEMKRFVDSCHKRGIAVILDLAINHAFGQNPLVRMYWDGSNNRPASNSPWFNPIAKHDFNVGYDFNHESPETKYFTKQVLAHWVEEFNIDGYRMDLSKGFTQRNTLGDVGQWNQYDQSRIDILTDYANTVWALDSGVYMIMEHFADNSEETELSNRGMMLWGNMNHAYSQSTMGYQSESNVYGVTHKSRGWSDMHLVGFMESHDEERLMYKNLNFGRANPEYSTKDLSTALDRIELASTFFFLLPGPKMLWQFGEVGYDYSIDFNGRVGNKPIRWDYFQDSNRRDVYDHFAELNALRNAHDVFRKDGSWELDLGGNTRRIGLSNDTMNVIILGNFDIVENDLNPIFDHDGMWYEYFTNDSLNVIDTAGALSFEPGEYRIYSDVRFKDAPGDTSVVTPPDTASSNRVIVQPTLVGQNGTEFRIETLDKDFVEIYIYDVNGNWIWKYEGYGMDEGVVNIRWNGSTQAGNPAANGVYIYRINRFGKSDVGRLVLLR